MLVEGRGRNTHAFGNLSDGELAILEEGFGNVNVALAHGPRTSADSPARPRSNEARCGPLPNDRPLEFGQGTEDVKDEAAAG